MSKTQQKMSNTVNKNKLKDKVALVLGASGDVGSAVVDLLEVNGAIICRHGRSGDYGADVRDTKQIKKLIDNVISRFGKIDVVVNSLSAPVRIGSFENKNWNDFLEQLNVQLKATVEVGRLVIPYMKKNNWGRIINILTSYTIGLPPSSLSDYVTSKYAMLGLTKALARELGKYNITVNAVSPGFIRNKFTKNVPEKFSEILISQTPLGRLTTAEDVAKVVGFLCSDAADFITGENINLSGGQVMD